MGWGGEIQPKAYLQSAGATHWLPHHLLQPIQYVESSPSFLLTRCRLCRRHMAANVYPPFRLRSWCRRHLWGGGGETQPKAYLLSAGATHWLPHHPLGPIRYVESSPSFLLTGCRLCCRHMASNVYPPFRLRSWCRRHLCVFLSSGYGGGNC